LGIVHSAWAEWRRVQELRNGAGIQPLLYRRTISNYVFDAIARNALPAFMAEPRVSVKAEAQTFKLFVGGLVARFKKGGEDKLGCSIPTQTAMAFMDADAQLPGMPAETAKVEIVWLPNEIWTKVEQVLVVARDGDTLIWEYSIEDAQDSAELIPIPPVAPDGPDDAGELVKPKDRPATIPQV
jgi:hypothetical protein